VTARLGSWAGGLALPLGTFCVDESHVVTRGACDPVLAPAPMSGSETAMSVGELEIERTSSYMGTPSLSVKYFLDVHRTGMESASLVVRASCRIGDKTRVDLGWTGLHSSVSTTVDPGESVVRSNVLFADWRTSDFDPEFCDVAFELQVPSPGSPTGMASDTIHEVCWRDAKIAAGPCEPGRPTPPPPAPLGKRSLSISEVVLTTEDYGMPGAGHVVVNVRADVTVHEPINPGGMLFLELQCPAPGGTRLESVALGGHDLSMPRPGESIVLYGSAFAGSPLPKPPASCRGHLLGRPDYYGGSSQVSLGRWCLRGGSTRKC
jgi:hypothetical protein